MYYSLPPLRTAYCSYVGLSSGFSSISAPIYQLTLSHDPVPLNTILSLCSLSIISSARLLLLSYWLDLTVFIALGLCLIPSWIYSRSSSWFRVPPLVGWGFPSSTPWPLGWTVSLLAKFCRPWLHAPLLLQVGSVPGSRAVRSSWTRTLAYRWGFYLRCRGALSCDRAASRPGILCAS